MGSRHYSDIRFAPEKRTDRDLALLYIKNLETYSKFALKNEMRAIRRLLPTAVLAVSLPREDHT